MLFERSGKRLFPSCLPVCLNSFFLFSRLFPSSSYNNTVFAQPFEIGLASALSFRGCHHSRSKEHIVRSLALYVFCRGNMCVVSYKTQIYWQRLKRAFLFYTYCTEKNEMFLYNSYCTHQERQTQETCCHNQDGCKFTE